MGFSVISIAPGLSEEQHRRAIANGPEFVDSEVDYPTLMARAGWTVTAQVDLTPAYAASCARQIQADEEHQDALTALVGPDECAERRAEWREKLAAITDGLLRRELFIASPDAINRVDDEREDET